MKQGLLVLWGLWAVLISCQVAALIETYEFSDQALENRYHVLTQELRCPKCQNQNIADSDAPISKDLRRSLHQQLELGASDEDIRDYMVARYGEFVRYRPRFGGINVILWLAPVILLLSGLVILAALLRTRAGSRNAAAHLDAEEQMRLKSLLQRVERDS
ncbi:MAG: cytochrome c-type biogenesis protein CcmH [Halioglobus sp.]|nr:cytochrome c-type biogenesis protein CcmH [Halioglobus sp.]